MSMADFERNLEEPHIAWDRHCEQEEKAYRALIAEKTCKDCRNCLKPGAWFENPGLLGFCDELMEFVGLDDSPIDNDCERFCE